MEPLLECLVFALTLGMTRASSAQLWAAASADRAPFLHSAAPCLSPHAPVLELCAAWLEHGPGLVPFPGVGSFPCLAHWGFTGLQDCACSVASVVSNSLRPHGP